MSFFFQTELPDASKERFNDTFLGSVCLLEGSERCCVRCVLPKERYALLIMTLQFRRRKQSFSTLRQKFSSHATLIIIPRWAALPPPQQERESNFRLDCIRNGAKKIKTNKLLLRRVWINTAARERSGAPNWTRARCFGARWNSNEAVKLPHHATTTVMNFNFLAQARSRAAVGRSLIAPKVRYTGLPAHALLHTFAQTKTSQR